jgi:hypothetical protein
MLPNIFSGEAFGAITLTDAVNRFPVQPSVIQRMGLFDEIGITTTNIMIDSIDGILSLIPDTPRSAPNNQIKKAQGVTRNFNTSHFPVETSIMASEVQNIRDYGAASLATLMSIRDRKLKTMANSLDVTLEYQRLGALKGIILDADGTTVKYNLFTEFGITQNTTNFAFSTTTTPIANALRDVQRKVYEALGDGLQGNGIVALCGKTWFESFVEHPNIKEKYLNWQAAGQLTEQGFLKPFNYNGFIFMEYYGTVSGVQFVADNEAYAFPVGVPGLYETYFAPGDFLSAANQIGLPRYSASELMDFDRGVKLMAESNPFSICKRPKCLVKLTAS